MRDFWINRLKKTIIYLSPTSFQLLYQLKKTATLLKFDLKIIINLVLSCRAYVNRWFAAYALASSKKRKCLITTSTNNITNSSNLAIKSMKTIAYTANKNNIWQARQPHLSPIKYPIILRKIKKSSQISFKLNRLPILALLVQSATNNHYLNSKRKVVKHISMSCHKIILIIPFLSRN